MFKNKFIVFLFILLFHLPVSAEPAITAPSSPTLSTEKASVPYPDFANEFLGHDKFEKFNRKMFNFNAKLNKYALRPLHVLWASVMPKYGMDRIQGVYDNIEYPRRLVSTVMQKDFKALKIETLRFLTNSTLGLGGMFDPAKRFFNLKPTNEDMEQALSKCKVKSGPYLVLPVIASTTPRGVMGRILETGLDPTTYVAAPVAALVKFGLFLNQTSMLQPMTVFLERSFADPYDMHRKIYGMERYIRLSNLDRKEVLDTEAAPLTDELVELEKEEFEPELLASKEGADGLITGDKIDAGTFISKEEVQAQKIENEANMKEEIAASTESESAAPQKELTVNTDEPLKGGTFTDEKLLKEAVQNSLELSPDIVLENYYPQSPVVDSMRTALFSLPGIDESIWSELSIWNRSFSKRIRTAQVELYPDRKPFKFRYIMQKDKNAPVVIIYPSVGEGLMSHHSVVMAKIFYDAGYSAIIEGSHFHFDFVNSMPADYRPGLPKNDAEHLKIATKRAIDFLEDKYESKFSKKVLLGTSFGAMISLFTADSEYKNDVLAINQYISINPPIELVYALNVLDKNNDEWNKNPNNLKHRTAVIAAKILDLFNQRDENKDFKIDRLPFTDYEGKLITGFILRQKLSDLIFTLENSKTPDKKELYSRIAVTSYKDYAKKYLLKEGQTLNDLAYITSLHSISDFLKKNHNYKIYHTLDDYFVNKSQLKTLRNYTGRNTVLISNGGHLGFLYRDEFQKDLKDTINLKRDLISNTKK